MVTARPQSGRVVSIDALRGFDMLWITGGAAVVRSALGLFDSPAARAIDRQFIHATWHGCNFEDVIFPLFLFIIGLAIPFSISRRLERGHDRRELLGHVIRRTLILLGLGMLYNGLLDFNFGNLRFAGVLQRLALGYFFTSLIVLYSGIRAQGAWFAGLLLSYWAVMSLVPVPGFGAGNFTPDGNLCYWVDQHFLPGRFYVYGDYPGDATGLLSTWPAVASTLLGVLCSHLLRTGLPDMRKVGYLSLGGVSAVILALVWSTVFPINKAMWTSSFVMFTGGISMLLLALFYWLIDVRGWRTWAFFFVVIGMNPITIYVAQRFFDFGQIADIFLHGVIESFGVYKPLVWAIAVLAVKWLFLYFLYRRKIFLRV